MKKQRIYTYIIPIIICINAVHGQQSASSFNKTNANTNKIEEKTGSRQLSSSSSGNYNTYLDLGEECSMCLYEDWKSGSLIMKDETVINDRLIRYNIYNQQMEFIMDDDTSALANPDDFERIIFGGHTFLYGPFLCNGAIHRGYMELLFDGRVSLLLHRYIKYEVKDNNPYIHPVDSNPTYFREDRYYYSDENGPAVPLPLKKKRLQELFNNPEKNINLFMKETKNKLRTKQDFINLFEFYLSNNST